VWTDITLRRRRSPRHPAPAGRDVGRPADRAVGTAASTLAATATATTTVARKTAEPLDERDAQPLPGGGEPHKLRHPAAPVLVALGSDPASVMAQIGHTDPAFTLLVYTHMLRRDQGERDRLRALVEAANGHQWALADASADPRAAVPRTRKPRDYGAF
jgi:hypothetical protein